MKIPGNLQGILWSKGIKHLDLEKDKIYIIHQILMYGSLDQIKWLKKIYGSDQVKKVFQKYPRKIYTKEALNFLSNYLLSVKINSPDSYVSTTPRNIR